jgi:hypothetical protein
MSIRLLSYDFDGPTPLSVWRPPERPSVFAILVFEPFRWLYSSDLTQTFEPIYVGRWRELRSAGFPSSHRWFPQWVRQAGSVDDLYIAVRAMPYASDTERGALADRLVRSYEPVCNLIALKH